MNKPGKGLVPLSYYTQSDIMHSSLWLTVSMVSDRGEYCLPSPPRLFSEIKQATPSCKY